MNAPWFKFFAADFLNDPDVDDLPEAAQGILVRMWCASWTYGSLPDDVEEIARKSKVRLGPMQLHVQSLLPFFVKQPDGTYISERQERERQRSGIVSKARHHAAKRRWNKGVDAIASAKPHANGDSNDDANWPANNDAKSRMPDVRCQIRESEPEKAKAVAPKSGAPLGLFPSQPKGGNGSKPKPEELVLPDWVPLQQWAEYNEMRLLIKKPMTTGARRYAIRTLTKLRDEGQDASAVLSQSVFRSWVGLFPVDPEPRRTSAPQSPKAERRLVDWEAPADLDVAAGTNIWNAALRELSEQIDPHSFSTWLKPTKSAGLKGDTLFVHAPTADFCAVLGNEKYSAAVARVLLDKQLTVVFVSPHEEAAA
jgi:DnaA N-terminal domain